MNINEVAFGRCEELFRLARKIYETEPELAKRYVTLARKIAMRHRIPLGSHDFCKKCNVIFIPGRTVKIRIASSKSAVIYECLKCGETKTYPFIKEKIEKKAKKQGK